MASECGFGETLAPGYDEGSEVARGGGRGHGCGHGRDIRLGCPRCPRLWFRQPMQGAGGDTQADMQEPGAGVAVATATQLRVLPALHRIEGASSHPTS